MDNSAISEQNELLKELLAVQKELLSTQTKIYKALSMIGFILGGGILSIVLVVAGT